MKEKESILKRYNELRVSKQMFEYMITNCEDYINRFSNLFNELDRQDLEPFYRYSVLNGNRVEGVEKNYKKVTSAYSDMSDAPDNVARLGADLIILRDFYKDSVENCKKTCEGIDVLRQLLLDLENKYTSAIKKYKHEINDIRMEMSELEEDYKSLTGDDDIMTVLINTDKYAEDYNTAYNATFNVDDSADDFDISDYYVDTPFKR